ncbi:MAG: translocation/assembly module TamB domain-containing protein, partial [Candidatus Latescibacteria bacterium]|nr:translocation/assembly module TamB domain-containing protein [Candidatus Latescibacterota bacterium]
GKSRLSLTVGGTWVAPVVLDGELNVENGTIKPAFLVDEVSDVNATIAIDPSFETVTGMRAVRISKASGRILGKRLNFENVQVGDDGWEKIKRPGLLSVINGTVDLDFGVITGHIDKGGQRNASLALHIPGFMKSNDKGSFIITGKDGDSFIVGASDTGDGLSPYISGKITVLSGDIYFPLLDENKAVGDTDFLSNIFWDLTIHAGSNVNYAHENKLTLREITANRMSKKLSNLNDNTFLSLLGNMAGTTITKTLARLEENSVFTVFGRLSDDSFRVTGNASSRSGTISYYGTEFDIERADLELDTSNSNMPTILTVRAKTVVYNDSTDVETEIYLVINSIDRTTGQRRETVGNVEVRKDDYLAVNTNRTIDAGALGLLQVEFRSNNPSDDTQEKILARLGISTDNILNAAAGAFSAGVDNYYFDPLMRPFEEVVKKYTRLDVVRFTPTFLGNIVRSQLGYTNRFAPENEYLPFDRSRIMLGEYLFNDWFLSYRGQYGVGRDFLSRNERGFFHEVALQYLINGNTRFQLNYNYDDIISKSEKSIEIRHDFEFD